MRKNMQTTWNMNIMYDSTQLTYSLGITNLLFGGCVNPCTTNLPARERALREREIG